MTDSNNSQWLSKPHISRRAALRAAILGATIPGALYLAKAANSADAADDNIHIPGAPNFLELGHGWPDKEGNAGKISYRHWSDALDIVGAGTAPANRKVKIWDDLYVGGLLNLRTYWVEPEVPRTWTAFIYARDINGQTKPFWKDATGTVQPLVARSATLVVAASNAYPQSKLGADFVCDGTADEEEINAAIAACTIGGTVVLTEGTFTTAASILMRTNYVSLVGQGSAATTILADNFNAPVIHIGNEVTPLAAWNVAVRDLQINCNGEIYNNPLCDGVRFYAYHSLLANLYVCNCAGHGINITGNAAAFCTGCIVRDCAVLNKPGGTAGQDNEKAAFYCGPYSSDHYMSNLNLFNLRYGIWFNGGGNYLVENCYIDYPQQAGVKLLDTALNHVNNCHITNPGQSGVHAGAAAIHAYNALDCVFTNCVLTAHANTAYAILIDPAHSGSVRRLIFADNIIGDGGPSGTAFPVGIQVQNLGGSAVVDHLHFMGNAFSRVTTPIAGEDCPGLEIHHNSGYVTENSGYDSFADTQTSKVVAHGLAGVPTSLAVTPRANPGAGGLWVSARDTVSFTVARGSATGPLSFDWHATLSG